MTTVYLDDQAFERFPRGIITQAVMLEHTADDIISIEEPWLAAYQLAQPTAPKSVLFTTVSRRHLWAACAPQVTVDVWNGTPLPEAPIEVMALVFTGVTLAKARELHRSRWEDPGKSKYAPHIEEAKRIIDVAKALPPPLGVTLQNRSGLDYKSADDLPIDFIPYLTKGVVALDIETTGLDPLTDKLVGVSLSHTPFSAVYIPCPDGVPPMLRAFMESEGLVWVGHNAKFDYKFLRAKGVNIVPPAHDTQLLAYILEIPGKRGLKALGVSVLGEEVIHFDDVAKGKTFDTVPLEEATQYACQDADLTLKLFGMLYRTDRGDPKLFDLYRDIEIPLIPILAKMELEGAAVDVEAARLLIAQLEREVLVIEGTMWALAGQQFDPDSTKDLHWLLYDKLGLEPIKETKTGYSTDKTVLQRYRDEQPLVALILEWRARQKMLSTYLRPLVASEPQRIHGQFNQMVTATGRLSSSNPNLQNQGPLVRQVYVAPPGSVLIAADYSQQELRLLAHMSQDPRLLAAFKNGDDIHRQTSELLKVPRKTAKIVNFGIAYGAGPDAVARTAGCSKQEARQILADHRIQYPVLYEWIAQAKVEAHMRGYAQTLWGRRRHLPNIRGFGELRAAAEREAVNMPIQGSAADLTKLAMRNLELDMPDWCPMILQIHDELVFELRKPELLESVEATIRWVMETADGGKLSVPLVVDIHHGHTWAELK